MATNWDTIEQDLNATFGTSKAAGDSGGGDVWKEYEKFKKYDHDEFHDDCWQYTNDQDIWDYIDSQDKICREQYNAFLTTWVTSCQPDAFQVQQLTAHVKTWRDSIAHPLRSLGYDVRDSKLLESWSGPAAQKYLEAVNKQGGAADELLTWFAAMEKSSTDANNTIKGILGSTLAYGKKIVSNCVDFPTPDDGQYGHRVNYAAQMFTNLNSWLQQIVSSGAWIQTMQGISDSLGDLVKYSKNFESGKWPESVLNDLDKLKKGDQGLAGQTNKDQSKPKPEQQAPQTTPDGTPVQGPEDVDKSKAKGKEI